PRVPIHNAVSPVRLLQQLTRALTALQQHSDGIAHGALTPNRIVLSTAGQIVIREHVVGSAIEALELSPRQLWSQFGILVPAGDRGRPTPSRRADVIQLALMALAMILGRPVGPNEYPHEIGKLLDEVDESVGRRSRLRGPLRHWLERALFV